MKYCDISLKQFKGTSPWMFFSSDNYSFDIRASSVRVCVCVLEPPAVFMAEVCDVMSV